MQERECLRVILHSMPYNEGFKTKGREIMPQLEEMSNQGNSLEQIINLLYNIGYRLTGSHKLTQELLTDVINA